MGKEIKLFHGLAPTMQEKLPTAVGGWKSLQRLDLAGNRLEEIPVEVRHIGAYASFVRYNYKFVSDPGVSRFVMRGKLPRDRTDG